MYGHHFNPSFPASIVVAEQIFRKKNGMSSEEDVYAADGSAAEAMLVNLDVASESENTSEEAILRKWQHDQERGYFSF